MQSTIRAVGKIVELAQLVHDKRGKELNSIEIERKKAATVALNCLYGVQTFVASRSKQALHIIENWQPCRISSANKFPAPFELFRISGCRCYSF